MAKGEQTQQVILAQAAQVFSERGYAGASMNDLVRATGLSKGAIYNHFGSKEMLAAQSFNFAMELVRERFREMLQGKNSSSERLFTVLDIFRSLVENPLFIGACPILTTSIEADDTNPLLRDHAREAMGEWREYIIRTITRGIEKSEFRPDLDTEAVATILMSSLEGGVMMSKLYADPKYIHHAADHLEQYMSMSILVDE